MNEKEKINSDVKYESTDANAVTLGFIGVGIIIAAIILTFLLWGLYGYFGQTAAEKTERRNEKQSKQSQSSPSLFECAEYTK